MGLERGSCPYFFLKERKEEEEEDDLLLPVLADDSEREYSERDSASFSVMDMRLSRSLSESSPACGPFSPYF